MRCDTNKDAVKGYAKGSHDMCMTANENITFLLFIMYFLLMLFSVSVMQTEMTILWSVLLYWFY